VDLKHCELRLPEEPQPETSGPKLSGADAVDDLDLCESDYAGLAAMRSDWEFTQLDRASLSRRLVGRKHHAMALKRRGEIGIRHRLLLNQSVQE
jgi:hypothetical protein